MRKSAAGFTLLEILVVLILVSLVGTILLQSLQHIYRLQARSGAELFHSQREAMRIDWFRSSVNGIMPDYPDGANKFKGGSRRMDGQTIASLNAPAGAFAPLLWRVDFDPKTGEMGLYAAEGEAPAILTWPGNEGRFLYMDDDGRNHEIWPPFSGRFPQVPRAILLEMGTVEQGRRIVAVPRGPDTPWPKRVDVMND